MDFYSSLYAASDYNLLVTSVTITSDRSTHVTMDFIEDDITEPEFEQVEVTFSGGDRVEFLTASTTVTIRDNDGREGGEKEICFCL